MQVVNRGLTHVSNLMIINEAETGKAVEMGVSNTMTIIVRTIKSPLLSHHTRHIRLTEERIQADSMMIIMTQVQN